MKYERKKLLAKLAYLYYIEEKSQSEIAAETGIYRTTVSRMLTEAKRERIVKIEIEGCWYGSFSFTGWNEYWFFLGEKSQPSC